MNTNPNMSEFVSEIKRFDSLEEDVDAMENSEDVGPIQLSYSNVLQELWCGKDFNEGNKLDTLSVGLLKLAYMC